LRLQGGGGRRPHHQRRRRRRAHRQGTTLIRARRRVAGPLAALVAGAFVAACGAPPPGADGYVRLSNHVDDWRDEVIYQLLVDRFADGDPNNNYSVDRTALAKYQGGDWQGIIDRIDYLKRLGVTTIWISPVVKNVENDANVHGYHGYWTQDFLRPNPHFGDLAKLQEMVEVAHQNGLKVILDIVTNHIGQLFYYDINLNGQPDETVFGAGPRYGGGDPTSPIWRVTEYDPDFQLGGVQAFTSLGSAGIAPILWRYEPDSNHMPVEPPEFQNPAWYSRRGRTLDYEDPEQLLHGDFPGGLKDVNTELPDVRAAMIRVFSHWIGVGNFDGFRIDTIKHVEHGFWQEFAPAMRRYAKSKGKEKFFLFGEAFDGRDDLVGSFTKNNELDSAFYFPLKFQVFDDVFKYNQPTRKIETLFVQRTQNYGAAAHEGGIGVSPQRALVTFLDNHDVPRFLFQKPSLTALHSALFFQFTFDGIPCIYYGTEQELAGGNDPGNRERLWDTGYSTGNATFQLLERLIGLRKLYPPLRRGDLQIRWVTDRTGDEEDAGIYAFERTHDGETVLVVGNASDTKASQTAFMGAQMQTSFPAGTRLQNVFPDDDPQDEVTVGTDGRVAVRVPARGGRVFVRADRIR
jgi:glycosidase